MENANAEKIGSLSNGYNSVFMDFDQHLVSYVHSDQEEEKEFLRQNCTTLDELMRSVVELDKQHSNKSRSRKVIKKIAPLIRFLEQYSKAIDVFVQGTEGAVAMPISVVWGVLRVVLIISSSFSGYFPKLLDMIEKLGTTVSIYECYEVMFDADKRFKSSLSSVYSHITHLLLKARRVFSRRGAKLLLRFIWSSFESDFQKDLDELSQLLAKLDQETTLVHRKTAHGALAKIELLSQETVTKQKRKDIMDWLAPWDAETGLIEIAQQRLEGTGTWVLHDDDFMNWISGQKSSILWIDGVPGVGKTVLSSLIINYLRRQSTLDNHMVCFYFCDKLDGLGRHGISLLSTMIAQICMQSKVIPKSVVEAFEQAQLYGRCRLSLADAPATLLQTLISDLDSLHIVVDGLDELEDCKEMFKLIRHYSSPTSNTRILVLGRDLPTLRVELEGYPRIHLDAAHMKTDIRTFVSEVAASLPIHDVSLRETIIEKVSTRSDGQFLWSRWVMDSLLQATSPSHLVSLIEEVPRGLSAIYTEFLRSLSRKHPHSQGIAVHLLQWMCCSKRPLTWAELGCALSADWTDGRPTTESALFLHAIIELGYPFVLYQHDQDFFRLQHLSVRDFLVGSVNRELVPDQLRRFLVEEDVASSEIASTCLSYIYNQESSCGPLTKYASRFWCEHVVESRWSSVLQDAVGNFLMDKNRRQAWLSDLLLYDGRGFSLFNVMRVRDKLNVWITQGQASKSEDLEPFLDWALDCIDILLWASTISDSVSPPLSYFEKLMAVRDLARRLRQSSRVLIAIRRMEDYLKDQPNGGDLVSSTHATNLWIYNALGILYDQEGETARSVFLHNRALSMQKAVLGASHIETIWTINELGRMHRHLGDFAESIAHHEQALALLRSILPAEHLEIVWTESTLARAVRSHGRPEEALTLHRNAHAILTRLLGDTHPHTLWKLGDMAQCYRDLGELDEAARCHRLAIKGRTEALGAEHPDTLWSMNDLGVVLTEQGNFSDALELQQRALEGQIKILGLDHEHTKWTRNILINLKAVTKAT